MLQEQKEILLKDLSARLPYGVKLAFYASATKQTHVCTLLGLEPQGDEPVIAKTENGSFYMLADHVKPYLFPLSSMTAEQKREYAHIVVMSGNLATLQLTGMTVQDWFSKNHFDYRGLIPMGLATDATGLNIY